MNNASNYELLKKIINEVDPIGLVDFDTPESLNEYDPELKAIFKKNIVQLSKEELGQWIYQVFVEFFDEKLAQRREQYDLIADRFLTAINDGNQT